MSFSLPSERVDNLYKFILRRFIQSIGVLLAVSLIIFIMLQLTGDPIELMLGEEGTQQDEIRLRKALGLDKSIRLQYGLFLKNALQGNLGISYHHGVPAMELVLERVPATLELVGFSMLFAILISIPLGVYAASKRGKFRDRAILSCSLIGISAPPFWVGIVCILFFSVALGWLPTSGRGGLEHLILPAGSLALYRIALFIRLIRSGMLDVLNQEYILTAHSKGLSEKIVFYKHALKNTLIPFITIGGLQMGSLFAGAIVTERIFAWPGMGRLILDSIQKLDYPVVMCWALITACIFIVINLIVDISYSFVDPRIRAN